MTILEGRRGRICSPWSLSTAILEILFQMSDTLTIFRQLTPERLRGSAPMNCPTGCVVMFVALCSFFGVELVRAGNTGMLLSQSGRDAGCEHHFLHCFERLCWALASVNLLKCRSFVYYTDVRLLSVSTSGFEILLNFGHRSIQSYWRIFRPLCRYNRGTLGMSARKRSR